MKFTASGKVQDGHDLPPDFAHRMRWERPRVDANHDAAGSRPVCVGSGWSLA